MTASRHDVSGPRPSCARQSALTAQIAPQMLRFCSQCDDHPVIYVLLITPIAIETKTFITSSSPIAEIQAHDEASLLQKLCHSRRHASFHHDDPSHTGARKLPDASTMMVRTPILIHYGCKFRSRCRAEVTLPPDPKWAGACCPKLLCGRTLL